MEMNDQRLRIAVPYLLIVVLGLMVIILPMWARTLGILGAVTGTCGLVWACWGTGILRWVFRRMKRERARSTPPAPSAETIGPIDEWIGLGVPCEKEIYDEMTKAIAGGWRLAQVPSLEKPREL